LKNFRNSHSLENFLELRRINAKAKKIFEQPRRDSWKSFVQSFNRSTPFSEIWKKARSIRYRLNRPNKCVPSAEQSEDFLSSINPDYPPSFEEVTMHETSTCSNHWLDQPFLLEELATALHWEKKNFTYGLVYFMRFFNTYLYQHL